MNNSSLDAELPDVPPPPVLWWYRVYGLVIGLGLILLSLLMLTAVILTFFVQSAPLKWSSLPASILGVGLYGFCGLVYLIVPRHTPRNLVAYLFHGALIGMTMFGCCTIPIAGALLYFWIQSDMRFYFGVGS